MKKFFFISLIAVSATSYAAEQVVYPSARVASRWLTNPTSGRVAGLGGAMVARGAEPAAMEINPASLAGIKGLEILLTHNAWVEGISQERLAVGYHIDCYGTLGVSFDYLNLGEVEHVIISPLGEAQTVGNLYPSAMAMGLVWAGDFGDWSAGVGLRGIFDNEIDRDFVTGARADLGGRYTHPEGWRAGLTLQNLSVDGSNTLRPLRSRGGIGYTTLNWERPIAVDLNVDWQVNDKEPVAWKTAIEWAAMQRLVLRGGWVFANDRTPHGPSVGAGWIFGLLEVDYAFYAAGDLGHSHLVSLRIIP